MRFPVFCQAYGRGSDDSYQARIELAGCLIFGQAAGFVSPAGAEKKEDKFKKCQATDFQKMN